jgi:signal transduction histidine kinase
MAGRRATRKSRAGARPGEETARALRERVKELSCLYHINQIFEESTGSPDDLFEHIVELIPPAWQYPEITSARIVLDGKSYATDGFREGCQRQAADVMVAGKCRGGVEVVYTKTRPSADEGPFLKDERSLLDAIARQIAVIVEHQQAEEEKERLHRQLMHADRLATIGQLAAGVAHELNEPLSSILGFAQLVKRDPALPEGAGQDIEKIVTASLHAREIIKKLLLFARQTPTFKGPMDFNSAVLRAIDLFKHYFEKEGIELVCVLCPEMPVMTADAGQLTQVLVNLVVNAVQAMPEGGKLIVQTHVEDRHAVCIVEDTGVGMTEEILDRLFVPFFTTKEVDRGTGLGLPVVHGIITAHGGTIDVKSRPGQGTTFTIRLPIDPTPDWEDRPKS